MLTDEVNEVDQSQLLTVLKGGPLRPGGTQTHSVQFMTPLPLTSLPALLGHALVPEYDGVPHHDVVLRGGSAHAGGGVLLEPEEPWSVVTVQAEDTIATHTLCC